MMCALMYEMEKACFPLLVSWRLYAFQVTLTSKQWWAKLTEEQRQHFHSISQQAASVYERKQEEACQSLQQKIAGLQQKLQAESSKRQSAEALHATAVEQLVSQSAAVTGEMVSRYATATKELISKHATDMEVMVSKNATALEKLASQHHVAWHATAMKQLESQHAAEANKQESMPARHSSDSKLFKYSVRGLSGHPFSGSIPRSVFEAEPNSALAQMYNGEWEHTKDAEGRAIVNSDPANWPLILNWLSFGSIPSSPSESLLAECRYWQLDKLLAAIDARNNIDICTTRADNHSLTVQRAPVGAKDGFIINGLLHDLPKKLSTAGSSGLHPCILFTLAGREWKLEMNNEHFKLTLITGPSLTTNHWKTKWGSGSLAVTKWTSAAVLFPPSRGRWFDWRAGEMKRILHPCMLSVDGSLQLEMTLAFKDDNSDQASPARVVACLRSSAVQMDACH